MWCARKRVIASDAGFDILLTDLDMPGGVDGDRLAKAATAIPSLKIIAMTGHNEGRLKDRSERRVSGARAHLQKPFSRTDLEEALI